MTKLLAKFLNLVNVVINIINTKRHRKRRHQAALLGVRFGLVQPKEKITMPAAIELTNEQKVKATLNIVTDTGKPAKVDGAPAWVVVSGNSQVVVAEDGLSADLISSDDPGDTIIMVKADANLGEGVEELSDTITLTVIGATAKNLGISLGNAEPK